METVLADVLVRERTAPFVGVPERADERRAPLHQPTRDG